MPSCHLIVGFPCKYLGMFLSMNHPHFWGLWCVLSEAVERGWGGALRQALPCFTTAPALMPRAGWARPSGSPRPSTAPLGPNFFVTVQLLLGKPSPGDGGWSWEEQQVPNFWSQTVHSDPGEASSLLQCSDFSSLRRGCDERRER